VEGPVKWAAMESNGKNMNSDGLPMAFACAVISLLSGPVATFDILREIACVAKT
jgi:hypothetical protein